MTLRMMLPTCPDGPVPEPPDSEEHDPDRWKEYIDWLRPYVGGSRVNGSIGPSWKKGAEELKKKKSEFFVAPATQGAYAMYKMNVSIAAESNNRTRSKGK